AYQVYASATATYLPSMWNEGEEQTVLSFETEQGIQLADGLWIADNGFTSQNNGMYYISVWGTDVTGQITSVAVSINEPDQAMVIKTYPNPVSDGKLHIQVSGSSQERNLDIRIMDARGDLVMNQPWTVSGTVTRVIDLSTLPPGAYMLTISGDQVNYHKKVILLTLY
ncbi:MAG TPA: T9SS type A sorting domain-containing protein, partial [Bacteroidales bacterium]|nr:T9SS type A sorting domain-containing protein [Bacteroidales bacterium]